MFQQLFPNFTKLTSTKNRLYKHKNNQQKKIVLSKNTWQHQYFLERSILI